MPAFCGPCAIEDNVFRRLSDPIRIPIAEGGPDVLCCREHAATVAKAVAKLHEYAFLEVPADVVAVLSGTEGVTEEDVTGEEPEHVTAATMVGRAMEMIQTGPAEPAEDDDTGEDDPVDDDAEWDRLLRDLGGEGQQPPAPEPKSTHKAKESVKGPRLGVKGVKPPKTKGESLTLREKRACREWLKAKGFRHNGKPVGDTGRLPNAGVEAWIAAGKPGL